MLNKNEFHLIFLKDILIIYIKRTLQSTYLFKKTQSAMFKHHNDITPERELCQILQNIIATFQNAVLSHSVSDSFMTPWTVACARLVCPWNFPGKNTGVGCHFLLQGIFLTEGSNPGLLHLLCWQVGASPLCHLEAHITENIYTHIYRTYIV